jgi:leucyl/phenylalanyl-tRNA---protein transferase
MPAQTQAKTQTQLPWLSPGDAFPDTSSAWGAADPAPGLLAGGGALDAATLLRAYSACIFPWFSAGEPILWWSPDPRMVLQTADFKLHPSLRKTLKHFSQQRSCSVRIDSQFDSVIRACAQRQRPGQSGTWIVPEMVAAYSALHAAGHAHSVETWVDGELVGGLYCVAIGKAVFGESMFSLQADASKIALAALVAFCRVQGIGMIDCQQKTAHLASLGAREMPRAAFARHVAQHLPLAAPVWQFEPLYWNSVLLPTATATPSPT